MEFMENWFYSEKNERDNFIKIIQNFNDFNHDPYLNYKDVLNDSLKFFIRRW